MIRLKANMCFSTVPLIASGTFGALVATRSYIIPGLVTLAWDGAFRVSGEYCARKWGARVAYSKADGSSWLEGGVLIVSSSALTCVRVVAAVLNNRFPRTIAGHACFVLSRTFLIKSSLGNFEEPGISTHKGAKSRKIRDAWAHMKCRVSRVSAFCSRFSPSSLHSWGLTMVFIPTVSSSDTFRHKVN